MNQELQSLFKKKADWLFEAKDAGYVAAAIRVANMLGKDNSDEYRSSPRLHSTKVRRWKSGGVTIRAFWYAAGWVLSEHGKRVLNRLTCVQIEVSGSKMAPGVHLVADVEVGVKPRADRDDFWVPGKWETVMLEAAGHIARMDETARLAEEAEEVQKLRTQLLVGVNV